MANLNAWQKISRVLPGYPFGNGAAGSTTISADPNTRATVTGTSTTSALTLGSAILSNGDIFVIHQTQGTNFGQWEISRVASGGGTTSIVTTTPLQYTYTTGAQVLKFNMNSTATLNAYSLPAWNGSTGGVTVINGRTSITVSGAVAGTGGGFRGTAAVGDPGTAATAESAAGQPGTQASGAGVGGGNGFVGAGGGYGTAGGSASGGSAYGSADLTLITNGGGGSGASANPSSNAGAGATSGSIIILISSSITLSAGVNNNGANSAGATDRSGGGGSGGAILGVCATASLGTNNATATGGTGGGASSVGTTGGVGRIAIHHSGSVSGTTNPTFTDVSDATLIESAPNFGFVV